MTALRELVTRMDAVLITAQSASSDYRDLTTKLSSNRTDVSPPCYGPAVNCNPFSHRIALALYIFVYATSLA